MVSILMSYVGISTAGSWLFIILWLVLIYHQFGRAAVAYVVNTERTDSVGMCRIRNENAQRRLTFLQSPLTMLLLAPIQPDERESSQYNTSVFVVSSFIHKMCKSLLWLQSDFRLFSSVCLRICDTAWTLGFS